MRPDDFIKLLEDKDVKYTHDGDGISVGGNLDLNYSKITRLPDNLSVNGGLYLDPENIEVCGYKHNCGVHKRTIFAVFLNKKPVICAVFFKGSIDEFGEWVEKWEREPDQLKADARECLNQLLAKAKPKEAQAVTAK